MTGSLIAWIKSDEDTELRELEQRPRAGSRISIRKWQVDVHCGVDQEGIRT